MINRVLDRRNAPEQFWYLALQWVIDVDNIIATERGGQIASPIQRAFGVTPDCSKLLVHIFFDPVYFYDDDHGGLKERPGQFVGWANDCGDALTKLIWAKDAGKIICRSVTRPCT